MKKILYLFTLFVLLINMSAQSLNLNQNWHAIFDYQQKGEKEKYYLNPPVGLMHPVKIGFLESQGMFYDGYVWYINEFALPGDRINGGKVTACFGAVDEEAKIYLNGKLLDIVNVGWKTPFKVDLTEAIDYNKKNLLAVRVFDKKFCGGIWKDVVIKYDNQLVEYPVVKKLRSEKVKGITATIRNKKQAALLRSNGINTIFSFSYILQNLKSDKLEDLVKNGNLPSLVKLGNYAQVAAGEQLVFMPIVWAFNTKIPQILQTSNYQKCVIFDGTTCKTTPCPQDKTLWENIYTPLILEIARLEKETGVMGGAAIDFEYYTGDLGGGFCYGDGTKGCYCDKCFYSFLKMYENTSQISPQKRYNYIKQNYSLPNYQKHLQRCMRKQAGELAKKTREIKKDFLLGMLPGTGNWFLDGIAQGFSSVDLPVLILSEEEYFTGYTNKSRKNLKVNIQALYLGGLIISAYNEFGLAAKMAEMGHKLEGYWLYHGEYLMQKSPPVVSINNQRPSEYCLKVRPEQYWPAIKRANEFLQTRPSFNKVSNKEYKQIPFVKCEDVRIAVNSIKLEKTRPPKISLKLDNLKSYSQKPELINNDTVVFTYPDSGNSMDFGSAFIKLKLQKNHKYKVSMEVKTEALSNPLLVGFQICSCRTGYALTHNLIRFECNDYTSICKYFIASDNEIAIVLTANVSGSGKVYFKNIKLEPLKSIIIKSSKLPEETSELMLDFNEKNISGYVVDPDTSLSYFNLIEGNDKSLWYLRELFPKKRAVIEMNVDFEKNKVLFKGKYK